MKIKKTSPGSLLLLLCVALAALLPGSAAAQDPREATHLQVAGPEDVPLGNPARILAVLRDAQSNPIGEATIVFTSPVSFAGTAAEMELGEARTDVDGVALLDYQLRAEGRNQFIARFYGDRTYQPSQASAVVLATGTGQLARRSAGVEVPFLGSWTLVLVLLGVWSVYLVAMLLVSQIPEARQRQR